VSTIFKIVPKGSHRSYKKIKISKDGTIPPGAKVWNKLKKKRSRTRACSEFGLTALDAIFLYQIWWTAQQPYICTWDNCPPPKIWSHGCLAAVAARGGCGVSSDRLPYLGYLFQFWWDHFATCDFKFGSIQMLGTQLCHILASNVNKYKYQVSGGMTDAILGNHIWHIQKWQYLS